MKLVKIIRERVFRAGYVLRRELIDMECGPDGVMEWTMAYNPSGDYIGNPRHARFLCVKLGIAPQKEGSRGCVCSVGFSSKDGKWYGWSHRAIYGFKIGSTCKKGDCHYRPRNKREFREACRLFWSDPGHEQIRAKFAVENGEAGVLVTWVYSNDVPNEDLRGTIGGTFSGYPSEWGRGEWTAKTVADAKQMAMDFAEGVS